jgi:HEAT repeat protein
VWTIIPHKEAVNTALVDEVQTTRQSLAVSLIDKDSASERLQGINMSHTLVEPDDKLLDKLLSTLDSDPNVNVRLAAVEALYLFHDHPKVKKGLIDSLSQQSSPMVQAALIDLMVSIRERRAVDALKSLLEEEGVNPEIKDRAEQGIKRLSF